MHDFLQSPVFLPARPAGANRPVMPDWVQRGLMRSFGEDDLPAYRASPRLPDRAGRKAKIQNRK
jgi:hypothetical protein